MSYAIAKSLVLPSTGRSMLRHAAEAGAAMALTIGKALNAFHPFNSGQASRVALTEDLVRYMRRQSVVWFTTCEEGPRWHDKQRARAASTSATPWSLSRGPAPASARAS